MEITQKEVDEFKRIFKEKYGYDYPEESAYEAASNLLGFVKILMDSAEEEIIKERKLKKEPKGFHITDGSYSCLVCGKTITGDESWYDQWGAKCLLCQKAVDEGIVPGFACKERDSRYSMWELERKFGIKHQTARKLVRQGSLKARIVTFADGNPYEYIFLKKENSHLIDPDRHSPARKSYDRHRNKKHKAYVKKKMAELRKEFKNKKCKNKNRQKTVS